MCNPVLAMIPPHCMPLARDLLIFQLEFVILTSPTHFTPPLATTSLVSVSIKLDLGFFGLFVLDSINR